MEIVIKTRRCYPCTCEVFEINRESANIADFGYMADIAPELAEPYACGCKVFIPNKNEAEEAMKIYGITIDEFNKVCEELEEKLFVGSCGLCV